MKRAIFWSSAVVLLAGVLTLGGNAWSQNKEPQAATANLPHKVGLIDMAHVFKHYKKFEFLREDLKAELTESEEKAKAMQTDIVQLQNLLKGAAGRKRKAYTKLEQDIGKKQVEFESFRKSGQRDLLKKEAAIYLQVYNETSEAVKKYADYFKYTLVIRFNRDDLDSENPSALLNGMNRQVVYHRGEDDITISVLDYLNKQYNKSAPAATAPPVNKIGKKPTQTETK